MQLSSANKRKGGIGPDPNTNACDQLHTAPRESPGASREGASGSQGASNFQEFQGLKGLCKVIAGRRECRAPGQEDILDDAEDAVGAEAQRLRVHHGRVDQVQAQRVRAVLVQDVGRVLRARPW